MKRGRQGEGGGKPKSFKDEAELITKITEYLARSQENKEMPNKAGCCLFLDISRTTYNVYKKKYPNAIKRFEDTTENAWIQRLGGNSPTGAIFYLKNAFKEDWKDKHETDITSAGEKVTGFQYIVPKNETNNNTKS